MLTKLQLAAIGGLAALALSGAQAQTFEGDGTTYTLGQVQQGNCNFMTAPAAASQNYAAINNDQWDGLKNCGKCAQVSCIDAQCADKSVSEIVYIVDRCPECKRGDLDLSPSVFKKVTGSSPSRLKISWKFVNCPNPGKLQYCLKDGSNPFFVAVQPANAAAGIASVKINGKATTMVDSAFYYVLNSQTPVDLSKVTVSLTSSTGATVEETVSLSVGSCTAGTSQFGGGGGAVTPPASTPKATTAAPKPATTPKSTTAAPKPATTPKATTVAPKPAKTPKATTAAPKSATVPKATTVAPKPAKTPKAATSTPKPAKNSKGETGKDASSPSASSTPASTPAPTSEYDDESDEEVSKPPTPKKTSKNCAIKIRRE
ncbi:hypothetical protein PybrP1_004175 [[Pythium] brassicae (nom. inval.)]|nr:hypothetical protein PybrP1_004175 [[Pythium] brassicae (nom. inval.)]